MLSGSPQCSVLGILGSVRSTPPRTIDNGGDQKTERATGKQDRSARAGLVRNVIFCCAPITFCGHGGE